MACSTIQSPPGKGGWIFELSVKIPLSSLRVKAFFRFK
jgi:hypothetical protein